MKRTLERPRLGTNLATSLAHDNCESISSKGTKRRRLSNDSKWIVNKLPELPYLYLKEKTSVVVLNDSPQSIANRLVECAKSLVCVGEYDGLKARATLAVDGTEFCIQLFNVTAKANECIIVEMQRLNGSPIVFHTVARNILAVAKTSYKVSTSLFPSKSCLQSSRLEIGGGIKKCSTSNEGANKEHDLFACTMEIVSSLLKKDRVDANLLGMESLQLLTSTQSSSDSMVRNASKVVLYGGNYIDVKSNLMSLIANENSDTCATSGSDSEDSIGDEANDTYSTFGDRYYQKMRVCALSALSNALEANRKTLEQSLGIDEWVGDDGVVSLLLSDLNRATNHPHEAYLAAKCLVTVLEYSITIRNKVVNQMGSSALRAALLSQKIGKATHHLLGSMSKSLLQIIEEEK